MERLVNNKCLEMLLTSVIDQIIKHDTLLCCRDTLNDTFNIRLGVLKQIRIYKKNGSFQVNRSFEYLDQLMRGKFRQL